MDATDRCHEIRARTEAAAHLICPFRAQGAWLVYLRLVFPFRGTRRGLFSSVRGKAVAAIVGLDPDLAEILVGACAHGIASIHGRDGVIVAVADEDLGFEDRRRSPWFPSGRPRSCSDCSLRGKSGDVQFGRGELADAIERRLRAAGETGAGESGFAEARPCGREHRHGLMLDGQIGIRGFIVLPARIAQIAIDGDDGPAIGVGGAGIRADGGDVASGAFALVVDRCADPEIFLWNGGIEVGGQCDGDLDARDVLGFAGLFERFPGERGFDNVDRSVARDFLAVELRPRLWGRPELSPVCCWMNS